MCGRFSLHADFDDLREYFHLAGSPMPFPPRYNIAPSQEVVAVRVEGGAWRLVLLRWGLVPFWAKDPKIGYRTINARAETVHKTPAFRAAFRKRRCIVPASGYFEWEKKGKEKQPFYIHRRDAAPMAFAGLWERWQDGETGREVESCAIITTTANELAGRLHDRMPVILEPEDFARWLDPEEQSPEMLSAPLKAPGEVLEMYPVSDYVSKPGNEGKRCIQPAERPSGAS